MLDFFSFSFNRACVKVKNKQSEIKLGIIFLFLLIITITVHQFLPSTKKNFNEIEKAAIRLATEWFTIIEKVKLEKRISFDEWKNIKHGALLGKDFSDITTTLGTLEAKETALNPEFAGLICKWLLENKIDSTKTVGVIISGSFPSIAISSLAAIQTIRARALIISSLGSSAYGANEPEATWIDYETWLMNRSNFKFTSSVITLGGENDSGGGLLEEGIEELKVSVKRNNRELYIPSSLEESIFYKTNYLLKKNIFLLINIGGNQASIGSCNHSPVLPTGKWHDYSVCNHDLRGVISRIYEKGIPVIHLLNIRDLAVKNGIVIGKVYVFK